MFRWLAAALDSSIGRKLIMALTGLLLVGFLIGHLAGNVLLFADDGGESFDEYAAFLGNHPLLPVAELGLVLLFGAHIAMAIRLTKENREARGRPYAIRSDKGMKTVGSASMIVTGLLILGYLIKHLIDFRFDAAYKATTAREATESTAALVKETIGSPVSALIYATGAIVLILHLSHGLRSAFQTLGASHPKLNPLLVYGGLALAVILGLGFLAFPVLFSLS